MVSGAEAYDGKAVKITGATGAGTYPFVQQTFKTVGKATYQMSLWFKKDANETKNAAAVKLEFWPEMLPGASTVQEGNTFQITNTKGQWQQVLYNFVAPFTAQSVSLLARIHSSSETVYYDNIEVYMVKPPEAMEIITDSIFYYPEQTDGMATASVLTSYFPEAVGGTVEFTLSDGDKVLAETKETLNEESKAYFSYDVGLLKELKKEYMIKGVLRDPEGNEVWTSEEPIYKFNRPKFLGADGVYRVNGEVFNPVVSYTVFPAHYAKAAEGGITVVQGSGEANLEAANDQGMKVLYTLYPGMLPAGHPDNAETTRKIVEKYKDDPRVFAWAVMDEPYLNMSDPDDHLRESYRIIREIDDNHPVYIVEATKKYFEKTAKVVDLLGIDPYLPGSNTERGKMNTDHVMMMTRLARESSGDLKPVLSLLQAFEWYKYLPDGDAERHMIYQTYMAGGKAHGYYNFSKPITRDGKSIPMHEITENDLWTKGIKGFYEVEHDDVFKHFVQREYPGFCHYEDDNVIYHGYIKNNHIFMIVMNQSITETVKVEVPLTSSDGSVEVSNYYATYFAGSEGDRIKGKNGVMPVTLEPYQTVVLEVQALKKTGDFADIDQEQFWSFLDLEKDTEPHFTDMDSHEWAKEAVEEMYKNGALNEKGEGLYAPGEKITRGDFAMFLINTLGLTAENAEENFADVDPGAEYAEAISIGRALGILNGVGENLYMPEAEITRQDLMAICARGMALIEETEKEAENTVEFSDWALVADSAKEPIATMTSLGIVKGNDDGTLNPLGNTTRAEAAVIMQRIHNRNKA